jgi:hypothetical protein
MKNFSVAVGILIGLFGCTSEQAAPSLQDYLVSAVKNQNHPDQYSACVVLASLPAKLDTIHIAEEIASTSGFSELCFSLLLADISSEGTKSFLGNFPEGDSISLLFREHERAGYPLGLLPPFVIKLLVMSEINDDALKKAIASFRAADGVFAESIAEGLAELYKSRPEHVNQVMIDQGVSEANIEYIKKAAEYLNKGN